MAIWLPDVVELLGLALAAAVRERERRHCGRLAVHLACRRNCDDERKPLTERHTPSGSSPSGSGSSSASPPRKGVAATALWRAAARAAHRAGRGVTVHDAGRGRPSEWTWDARPRATPKE